MTGQSAAVAPARYWGTLILAGLMVAVTVPRHAGFLVFLWLALFSVRLLHAIFVMVREPSRRGELGVRLGIWVVAFAAIGAWHGYWTRAARLDADRVVASIARYQSQHGTYPENLRQLGLDEKGLRRQWMLGYHLDKQEPTLVYASTFGLFDAYVYDFPKHQWDYAAD